MAGGGEAGAKVGEAVAKLREAAADIRDPKEVQPSPLCPKRSQSEGLLTGGQVLGPEAPLARKAADCRTKLRRGDVAVSLWLAAAKNFKNSKALSPAAFGGGGGGGGGALLALPAPPVGVLGFDADRWLGRLPREVLPPHTRHPRHNRHPRHTIHPRVT